MKNTISIFTIFVFAVLVFTSCGDSKSTLPEKIDLTYKFEKGDKFQYRLTTTQTSEEQIQADSTITISSKQSDSFVMDFEVIDIDADKIAEMNVTITSIKVDIDANGEKMNFDSGKNPSKEEQQKFWQYAMQYSTPFRARVTSKGEVIEVSRLDKMIEKMNSLQPQQRELQPAEKAKLSQELSEGIIRPVTQLIFREFPQKQVAKDSVWEKNYPGQLSVFQIKNNAKFKVEDIVEIDGNNTAKIDVDLGITWEGEKKGEQQGLKYNFEDPKISGSGSILFNIDNGMLTKSETLTTVELVAHLEGKDAMQKTLKTTRKDLSSNKNVVELISK